MPTDARLQELAERLNIAPERLRDLEMTRGIDVARLEYVRESVMQRIMRRFAYPDLVNARVQFRARQQRDEQGTIPPNARARALSQLDGVRARYMGKAFVAGMPVGATVAPDALLPEMGGLTPGGWIALGPGNIGGRTRSLVVHPQNPDILWAGSVGGGVWRTDDGGLNWRPLDDFMANLAVSTIVMDPLQPDVLYAGTGEGFIGVSELSVQGAGIFSFDGKKWAQIAATNRPEMQAINRLAISRDGKVLLAATPNGIWRSEDADRLTWTRVLHAPVADVDCDPNDADRAIAGGLGIGEAFFSDDGGKTWTLATHALPWGGRVEVAYAAADSKVVYASVDMDGGQIWRSDDGGMSYQKRDTVRSSDGVEARYLGDQGSYGNVIWAGHPTDVDFVIVGGIDLWRSFDGGKSLTDFSLWWNADRGSAHADHHAIVADPRFDGTANKTVYFTNDGGIFKAGDVFTVGSDADRVQGWQELVNTYEVTQFYAGAGHPSTGEIIGGTQDNGTVRFDPAAGAQAWTTILSGDGGACASDPTDPNYLYGEYVHLSIHRNSSGGTGPSEYISGTYYDFAQQDWFWKPAPYTIEDARTRNALFIAPFVLDPNDPNRILAGGLHLWRTNDARTLNTDATGPTWERIRSSAGSYISAMAIARGDADLVWLGHESGAVFVSTNATYNWPTWSRMGASDLPARFCTSIVIDPDTHDRVFATFGGYSRGNIWKTNDGGKKWINIGASLPEAPVRAMAIHPKKPKFLYAGTEVGVFASEDEGATWSPSNEGATNCSVDDLFWMDLRLICVTHGRGMFEIDLSAA